ncbi:hypothetical protein AAWM_06978 [Aspergillus awamori]|uniref:N-acetyltransferase domain-containing protein n=1 Tax=Aspergillus awamori TaxID=105351 RepID=A0A401KXQ7_ASPAW|nr:hypothetical protein AAWM_06978 [Aspergillus awamori]
MILSRLTDPHWAFLFLPSTTPSTIISSTTSRLPHTLSTSRDVRRHEVVLTTTSGTETTPGNEDDELNGRERVVGYARWTLPPSLANRDDVWLSAQVAEPSAQEKEEYRRMFDLGSDEKGRVKGMKSDGLLEFRGDPLEKVEERVLRDVVGGEEVLTLEYLTTHPDYWRQGVGSMLVQSGVRVADQYGMKTYVMSEPAGLKVYLNHGFEVVDEITVEYAQFGGTEPTTHYFLLTPSAISLFQSSGVERLSQAQLLSDENDVTEPSSMIKLCSHTANLLLLENIAEQRVAGRLPSQGLTARVAQALEVSKLWNWKSGFRFCRGWLTFRGRRKIGTSPKPPVNAARV